MWWNGAWNDDTYLQPGGSNELDYLFTMSLNTAHIDVQRAQRVEHRRDEMLGEAAVDADSQRSAGSGAANGRHSFID